MKLSEFKASLVYDEFWACQDSIVRPCVKKRKKKKTLRFLKLILKLCPKFPNSEPELSPW